MVTLCPDDALECPEALELDLERSELSHCPEAAGCPEAELDL